MPPANYDDSDRDSLRQRVAELEASLRSEKLSQNATEQRFNAENRALKTQLEHAQLSATVQNAAASGDTNVQALLAEKQIFIEKSHTEKKRYEDLRARYDGALIARCLLQPRHFAEVLTCKLRTALQREHQDEAERMKDQHARELASARAGKNELVRKLALAEAAASGDGSMLQVSRNLAAAFQQWQEDTMPDTLVGRRT